MLGRPKRGHGITQLNLNLASAGAQMVAWIAFLRCAGVAAAVCRQALRAQRTVVIKWGLVETLAAPEPFLMGAFAYVLFMRDGSHSAEGWATVVRVTIS